MRISDWSSDVCSSELSAQERLSSARLTFPESRHEGGYGSGFLFHLAAHEGHAPGFPYQFHHRIHMLAGKSRSDILDRQIQRNGDPRMLNSAASSARKQSDIDESGGRAAMHPSGGARKDRLRSEEHTSELQSLMRIYYAVFCLK